MLADENFGKVLMNHQSTKILCYKVLSGNVANKLHYRSIKHLDHIYLTQQVLGLYMYIYACVPMIDDVEILMKSTCVHDTLYEYV